MSAREHGANSHFRGGGGGGGGGGHRGGTRGGSHAQSLAAHGGGQLPGGGASNGASSAAAAPPSAAAAGTGAPHAAAAAAPEGATSAGAAADAGAPLVDPAAAAAGAWVEVETVVGTRLRGRIFALDTEAGVIALQGVANSATGEPGQQVPGAPSAAISAAAGVAAAAQATAAAAGAGASASAASSAAGKHAAAQVDLHIIRLAAVRSITAAPQDAALNGSELVAPSPLPPLIPIVAMSDEQLRLKEQLAVRAERERNSRIGVGVPPEAQDVFDALAKTLPVAWKGQAIAVMDDVLIDPPYTPASCSLIPKKNASDSTLSRVRKVLEGERRRLGLE